jgi:hypothetical protein
MVMERADNGGRENSRGFPLTPPAAVPRTVHGGKDTSAVYARLRPIGWSWAQIAIREVNLHFAEIEDRDDTTETRTFKFNDRRCTLLF